jgi:hypothetical protein
MTQYSSSSSKMSGLVRLHDQVLFARPTTGSTQSSLGRLFNVWITLCDPWSSHDHALVVTAGCRVHLVDDHDHDHDNMRVSECEWRLSNNTDASNATEGGVGHPTHKRTNLGWNRSP